MSKIAAKKYAAAWGDLALFAVENRDPARAAECARLAAQWAEVAS